ncbi:killer cell lectin-like receptor subfamily F member 1 isoform X4 [Lynx canadensis]|nr:killer cell lectin-like receptor subfamily F member 1 isoform X4 [Lynx canadensis]
MQDEERYMTLNLQWKKRSSMETSQLKFKDSSVMLPWCKILLGISGTINGILVLTLISLCLLVSQGVLQKCQKGNNSNLTQHDDIGNPKMNNGTRGNISNKDTSHCGSQATDHTGFYTEKPKTIKLRVDWAQLYIPGKGMDLGGWFSIRFKDICHKRTS